MKSEYRRIKISKTMAGDEVFYKIGHRFKPENMVPCFVKCTINDEKILVKFPNGGYMTDLAKNFHIKVN